MATVKVKFRKSSVPCKAGTVVYQLIHQRKVRYLTTKIHLFPQQWNAEEGKIALLEIKNNSLMLFYQRQIDTHLLLFRQIIDQLKNDKGEFTVKDIVDKFQHPHVNITVLAFMNEQISYLEKNKRSGTAQNYASTLRSFSDFLNNIDISYDIFDEQLISEYNDWLSLKGVVRNTISFYMRNLRTIYNKAVRQNLVKQTFPFRNVYTGIDKTRKRAVDENIIIRLKQAGLKEGSALALSRDIFLFCYYARGMAFIDVAYLQKKDIRNGCICYIRKKTGQQLVIRLEKCMQEIIDRYINRSKGLPYIFPLITSEDYNHSYVQYKTALGYHNRKLKCLSQRLELNISLSSYTPRHSWATTARNQNIPLAVISAGMGHASERTTEIYLASLENSLIDQANFNLISRIDK